MVTLRNYQKTLYEATRRSMASGHRRPLVVAPCGAGKSYLFAAMAESTKGDVLVLTHRRELLHQHEELLRNLGITNTRVAMVITEANHLGDHATPRLIITDEAHLSRSNIWMRVMEHYNTWTVGFTATPVRLDGKPLGDVYDDIVQGVTVKELIEQNCLAPFDYYAPVTVDADGLKVKRGDYVIADLEQLMTDRAIYSDVLRSWERIAQGEKTIAYCVSVRHAKETAEMFNAAGYPAVELDGSTPEKARAQIMQDFRDGKYLVLCNVGIISEGVSINDVSCCLLLRPTQSHALYWQQAMRCMRYLPGKTAKIIDCVGNYSRNPLPDSDVIWSLQKASPKPPRMNRSGDYTIRTCAECFKVFATAPVCPYCGAEYPLSQRELDAHAEIELKKLTAQEAAQAEQRRKQMRREVGMARDLPALLKIAQERGYKPSWAYQMMRVRGRK